ncbi:poly(U)-specific endoribonuclease homolog [Chelonus insularis]|uniref:poly(U)-specific endoribonuclease homolog n=1 Tax=Chelonus insularis TaxID=460826 RepID=UPI00158E233D|nr:poly(U)-specific endoribonuclease homolog [Chelonus insularis]
MFASISDRKIISIIVYAAIILIVSDIDVSEAKWGRSGGGRISSSRGSFGGSRSSGRSRTPVSRPPVYHPPPPRPPSRPSYPSAPPINHPISHPPISSPPHPKPSAPNSPPLNSKDSSNIFIHQEGGGRPKPPLNHDVHQTSPVKPGESINKVNMPTSQNVPIGSPSNNYPPWANPSAKPGSVPPIGSPSAPYPNTRPIGTPSASAPYPANHPVGMPHPSNPSTGISSAPYPNSHPVGMPKPSNPNTPIGFHPPGHSTNSIGQPHQAPTLGSGVPHSPGHAPTNYGPPPVYGAPSGTHGGYAPPPPYSGGYYNNPGMNYHPPAYGQPPSYHQSIGAGQPTYMHPPAYGGGGSQPFVPGQSVIVLPNAPKEPGLGSMVKQALVFSTINAGVNRLINGAPHHHWHDSSYHPSNPTGSTSTVTNNTTIINNNYGVPDGQQIGTSSGPYPNQFPSSSNNYPSSNPNYYPGGYNNNNNNNNPNSANTPNSFPTLNPGNAPVGNNNINNGNNFPNRISGNVGTNYNNTNQFNGNLNNGTTTSPPEEVIPVTYYISEDELYNLTEKLFAQNELKTNQRLYVLNLQQKVSNVSNVKDESPNPLFYLDTAAYSHPTISVLREMYENYEFNSTKKENTTKSSRMKESLLIDTFLTTDVMTSAIKWLQEKYYIEPDDFEVKDSLRHTWFTKMDGYTSGFERIFMAEWYPGPSLLGGQNWIYFDHEEYQKKLNYLSYVDKVNINNDVSLVKVNIEMAGVVKPNVTMLIGTPPELEMALYTVCYYARPNDICPVKLGGVKFNMYTHSFRYFGKDLMDLGIIIF